MMGPLETILVSKNITDFITRQSIDCNAQQKIHAVLLQDRVGVIRVALLRQVNILDLSLVRDALLQLHTPVVSDDKQRVLDAFDGKPMSVIVLESHFELLIDESVLLIPVVYLDCE